MPRRIYDLLNGCTPDDDDPPPRPAPPRRLPPAWRDPARREPLEAALATIATIKNPYWRRLFWQRVQSDHPSPRAIRRGVMLLSNPVVRLWVLYACCTPGQPIPRRDVPAARSPMPRSAA
jgi:hypothetical protein